MSTPRYETAFLFDVEDTLPDDDHVTDEPTAATFAAAWASAAPGRKKRPSASAAPRPPFLRPPYPPPPPPSRFHSPSKPGGSFRHTKPLGKPRGSARKLRFSLAVTVPEPTCGCPLAVDAVAPRGARPRRSGLSPSGAA